MKFVVDTNILFSYFWKKSFTRKILMSQDITLIAPEYALEEIKQYRQDILRKTKLKNSEFKIIRTDLAIAVEFIPLKEYSPFLKKALKVSPDPDDIDFFALALKYDYAIWSNDSRLKNQKKVAVFSTADLLDKFSSILFPDEVS